MTVGNPSGRLGAFQPLNESNAVRYRQCIIGPGSLGTARAIGNGTFAELGANALLGKTPATRRRDMNWGPVGRGMVVKVVLKDGHCDVEGSGGIW